MLFDEEVPRLLREITMSFCCLFSESSTYDKCNDQTGCTLGDINTESWVDTYKHTGSGEDSNSILSVCLDSDVESGNSWIFLVRCQEMNSVSNTTTHCFLWLIRQSSYSYVYWTQLDIFNNWFDFIIQIILYRHSRISVDSLPDLDLFTSPESSTSASTESDLGEDIESFVWRGLTFPVP